MIVQEEFISIKTTPDVVERWLTDPKLFDQWRSPIVLIEPLEGDLMAQGSMFRLRLKTLALAGSTYLVNERDNEHLLFVMDGLWRGTELWRWFRDGERTIVQNRVEYVVPNDALRVFVVSFGRLFAQLDMKLQLTNLRIAIEGGVRTMPIREPSLPG
ncbi:MAG: SRPBCC family protein [Oscillochloris sp.]|nr:SRPBCC family protein [Oscillochloris sp.]